jgi:hypothetical protein
MFNRLNTNENMEVKTTLTTILFITTVICAVGWLNRWVSCAALVKYILDKGYTPPSDEETKACAEYVWNKLLRRRG